MVMYFPRYRYLIGSNLALCFAVVIKYLGMYMTMCLILSCAKEAMYIVLVGVTKVRLLNESRFKEHQMSLVVSLVTQRHCALVLHFFILFFFQVYLNVIFYYDVCCTSRIRLVFAVQRNFEIKKTIRRF